MKQIITLVIVIAIAFILLYRLGHDVMPVYNGEREPIITDSVSDFDFPVTADGLLIRYPSY